MSKLKPKNIILVMLFLFAIFLRFWKAGEWFSFNFDEEYQAFLAWSQVQDFHPIWIGVSAGNTGFYLGPAFTYLNALLFAFSKGDPLILSYFAPALGIITAASVYIVTSKIFSPRIAIFSSLIYTISPLLNFYDRRFWNPSPIPFLTIWLFFALQKIRQDTRWFILISAVMATALHVHLSLLVFWPVVLFLAIKYFKKISFVTWSVSILLYAVLVSPLLVYDKVHNFDNLRTPIRMLSQRSETSAVVRISEHFVGLWNSLSRFWYLQPHTSLQLEMGFVVPGAPTHAISILSFFSLFVLLFLFYKGKHETKYFLILSMMVVSLTAFIFYPAYILEYYLLSFFTLLSVAVGIWLASVNPKLSWFIIIMFITSSAITIFTCTQSQYGLLARKHKILNITQKINGQPYGVILGAKEGVTYSAYGGWCYLFQIYTGKPSYCPADESFAWIYNSQGVSSKVQTQINLMQDLNIETVK